MQGGEVEVHVEHQPSGQWGRPYELVDLHAAVTAVGRRTSRLLYNLIFKNHSSVAVSGSDEGCDEDSVHIMKLRGGHTQPYSVYLGMRHSQAAAAFGLVSKKV
jgi:hypothetical protein